MTDIYIRRGDDPRKGCRRVVILAFLVCVAIAVLVILLSRPRPVAEEAPLEPLLVEELTAEDTPEPEGEPAAAPASDPGPDLLAYARKLAVEQEFLEARNKCYEILDKSSNQKVLAAAEQLLGQVNTQLVFTRRAMPEKVEYTVRAGDTLGALAKKFGTTIELIQKGNNISGALIRKGDRYRILNGRFSAVVDKSENTLVIKLNDRFFKRYRVGTGKFARTPTGDFQITDRIAQPTWWRPDGKAIPYGDPDNLLGTHWLSLNIPGYGIHGTWQPETIGKQSSEGCICLLNEEIAELFTLLPIGTPVTITE